MIRVVKMKIYYICYFWTVYDILEFYSIGLEYYGFNSLLFSPRYNIESRWTDFFPPEVRLIKKGLDWLDG